MDLMITLDKSYPTDDVVICPRTNEKIEVTACKKCIFLRIVLGDRVKCGWSQEKENYINGRTFTDTYGDVYRSPIG